MCFLAGFLNIHLIRVKTFAAWVKKTSRKRPRTTTRSRQYTSEMRKVNSTKMRRISSTWTRSGVPKDENLEFFCRVGNWEIHHSTCVIMIWNFHKILYDKISPCNPPFQKSKCMLAISQHKSHRILIMVPDCRITIDTWDLVAWILSDCGSFRWKEEWSRGRCRCLDSQMFGARSSKMRFSEIETE